VNLDPPRHLQVFTPAALKACARQAGWKTINVLTSAANADNFIGASYGVRKFYSARRSKKTTSEIHLLRALRSLFFQFREACQLRRQPELGEEAILICHK
jgi:hypothetical protein